MNKEHKKNMIAKVLEQTAKKSALVAEGSRCAYIFHQPNLAIQWINLVKNN